MAKSQTRRAVSIPRELYDRLKDLSAARGIPIAQILKQGAAAILDGRLPLDAAIPSHELADATATARGTSARFDRPAGKAAAALGTPASVERRRVAAPVPNPGGFCAICANDISPSRPGSRVPAIDYIEILESSGEMLLVCLDCQELHPRDAGDRYDLGRGQSSPVGMSDGTRRTRSAQHR